MASRAAEAEAINREPWIVEIAMRGSHWFEHKQQRGWDEAKLLSEIDRYSRSEVAENFHADPVVVEGERLIQANTDWFSYHWFSAGLPRVSVGHRLAASFCATRVPEDCAAEALLPWPAFAIDVPRGIIPIKQRDDLWVAHVIAFPQMMVTGLEAQCFFMVTAHDSVRGVRADKASPLGGPVLSTRDIARYAEGLLVSRDYFARERGLALRLALGVILELSAHRPASARASGGVPLRRSRHGEPQCTMVRLTRDVKVDCRQHVRDYIRGVSDRALSVQHMVRGHWKMQTHGEGGRERKFIHVEPYWRGPDDAPIALKNHVLTGEAPHD